MDCFNVTILGCGSAKPTLRHSPTCQVVNYRGNRFLVDCGEGVQIGLARSRIPVGKIHHIMLSHLHGDHCLGLVGLLSSLVMGQRLGEIVIHAQPDAERLFRPMLDYYCPGLCSQDGAEAASGGLTVRFAPFDPSVSAVIYEDRRIEVLTIPLRHRVPTAGFLFREKTKERHLNVDRARRYGIPAAYYNVIKQGGDWTDVDGRLIPNEELTMPPSPSRSYAFCSDTVQTSSIIPLVAGADLLYHEATYGEADRTKAAERGHSTARQAAEIAAQAQVGRLVLGHFSSSFNSDDEEALLLAEARAVFPSTELAREQLVLDV